MKTKTKIKAGVVSPNHNETLVCDASKTRGMKTKTHVRAGGVRPNHSEALVLES
jgi:stalled ribosome alternative rescue factor ArfA